MNTEDINELEFNNGLETRFYKLEKLCRWEHKDEVDSMLLGGVAPSKVSKWCKDRGFIISRQKLYDYKELLQQATTKQIQVEQLLGLGTPTRVPIVLKALGMNSAKDLVKNEMQVLDCIIQLGYNTLATNPTLRVQDAMKAIELKNKLTSGSHGGLTEYGLEELRELEETKFNAIIKVVMKYVPQDKYDELQQEIAEAERRFYEDYAPELIEEYEDEVQRKVEDLRKEVVVSDENS